MSKNSKPLAQSMKILVVDDDNLSRKLLSRALETAGHEVVECRDGAEAIQIIEADGPAFLVLDYEMPEFTGAQVCEIVRSNPIPEIAQAPIIMLTAHAGEEHEVECLRAGANDFVSKPVNTAVLLARIETHFRLHALQQQLREQNAELERQNELRELDLEAARMTQQAIIPARMPALDGWTFSACYQPVIQVGGDIYDWLRLGNGNFLFWVADATGHGASAALLTTLAKLVFRHAADEAEDPAGILRIVNHDFCSTFKSRTYMTALCVVLDTHSGDLRSAGAGHPPLLIRRRNGEVETLRSEAPPVGIRENFQPTEAVTSIDSGDAFLLYTDGFYGMANAAGERLAPEALEGILSSGPDESCRMIDHLLSAVRRFAGSESLPDDIAAVAGTRA
jgi:serine phosphatase RsbU (regulator of sigma subunit)